MEREKIKEVRVGDRYAVITEGMKNAEYIIKIDRIDFAFENAKKYADFMVYYKIGKKEEHCRACWNYRNFE